MATCNFHTNNCTRYFIIGENKYITQDLIDANGWDQDWLGDFDDDGTQFNFECEKSNIQSALKKKGWDSAADWCEDYQESIDGGEVIAEKETSFSYGGAEISLTIKALVRSGYYEAACMDLDGEVEILSGGEAWSGTPKYELFGEYSFDAQDVIDDDWTGHAGLNHLQGKNIVKKLESIIEGLRNEAELVFSEFCEDEVGCLGVLNNGEAIYIKTGKRLFEEAQEAAAKGGKAA